MTPLARRTPISPKELGELAHLLFEWPIRRSPRLSLPLCILFAAVLQALMIVLFSISYQTPSETLPSVPQVYFLPADSAAGHQLAPWLEANDPAVFSPLRAAHDAIPPPPPLNYRPSYEEPPPPLRPLPLEAPESLDPPSLPLVGGILRRKPTPALNPITPAVSSPGTVVRWQDDLAVRASLDSPATSVAPRPCGFSVQPSLYEVAVNGDGIPTHCVLIETSGDSACDEEGRVWIQMQRFAPAERTSWGRVIIVWGAPTHNTATNTTVRP